MALLALAADAASAADRAIIVPTRSAGIELRRTIDTLWLIEGWRPTAADCARLEVDPAAPAGAFAWPDVVTRADLYHRLHGRLGASARLLSPIEREVLLRRASDAATAAGAAPPFRVRPGLLAEALALYDALRRRKRTVDDFERVVTDRLAPSADTDRGARRLLQQTRYLVATFREYERALAVRALADENRLRDTLGSRSLDRPYRHVVVTVIDDVGEAAGLWPADFDLLMRIDGLERLDVVATEAQLSAGFRERLEVLLPGIETCRPRDLEEGQPVVEAPPMAARTLHFQYRDRERELAETVRRTKARDDGPLDQVAFVYQRPLPYLYLARQLLESAGMPYEATDTLPLAAEPYVASFDLALSCALDGFSRATLVALLGAAHFGWGRDRRPLAPADLSAFDEALAERDLEASRADLARHLADMCQLAADSERKPSAARVAHAAEAAIELFDALSPLADDAPVTRHLERLVGFLRAHERVGRPADRSPERLLRARAALLGLLEHLRRAHVDHGDRTTTLRELAPTIRRWIEAQTFAPRSGEGGVRLLDATAARYGLFAAVHLLGLVDGEWPEPASRSVFYPSGVLKDLNWPQEQQRIDAARAAFVDLLRLPLRRVSVSTFTLEGDALVAASTLLEDVDRSGLPVARLDEEPRTPVFASEAMMQRPVDPAAVTGEAAGWLARRLGRADPAGSEFHGRAGAYARRVHAVTAVELYLTCPFKYFASKVLRLGEEVEDSPLLSPLARGRFVHEVFQEFFLRWADEGGTTVTSEAVPAARRVFELTVEDLLPRLAPQDRDIERARLLGTAASPGMGDRVLQIEAESDTPVEERLLEYDLAGTYTMTGEAGPRDVALRGIADRIDLLTDGTLRIIDYKTGRAPDPKRAVQLPIYGTCAEVALAGRRGRDWRVGAAAYVAFGESKTWVPVIGGPGERDAALADAQRRFVGALDRIACGEFPARPSSPRLCGTCAFAPVCRKDVPHGD